MIVISLQSGSSADSIYLAANGVRLLFDAGIPGYIAQRRRADQAVDICSVDAVFISHEHKDHVKCRGVFQRKFGLPVHIIRKTLAAARARYDLRFGWLCTTTHRMVQRRMVQRRMVQRT